MKIGNKQCFVCAFMVLIFGHLAGIGPFLQVYAEEAMKPAANCPAGDPNVRISAKIRSVELIRQEKDMISFRIHAHIGIANVSAEPVFVFSGLASDKYPHPKYGAVLLARTEAQALSCRYIYSWGAFPTIDMSPYWQNLRDRLDQETPPPDVIRKIEPKNSWEFDKDISLAITKYKISYEKALDEIFNNPTIWLQVDLLMWPDNLEFDMRKPDFGINYGLSLRERWRPRHLILQNLKTAPVELTLPITAPVERTLPIMAQVAIKNKDEGDAFLVANKEEDGVREIPNSGGVQYKVLTQGNGPKPTETDTVVANFLGKTIDGKLVENERKRKVVISNFYVSGLKTALLGMSIGSKWEVVIPPEQAFGERGYELIGPNETIIFEIELLDIQRELNP